MDYQSAAEERSIVIRELADTADDPDDTLVAASVAMVRDSRQHPDLRAGSSVRGAIDHTMLSHELALLRGVAVDDDGVTLDAAKLALSGRLRIREGCTRRPEDIVTELWATHFGPDRATDDTTDPSGADEGPGKA
jgi:MoxR-like ATPase